MTPMQSLKNQFDTFKSLLPPIFKETALNKSDDKTFKSYWCGDVYIVNMKGVRSDFIKTFKAKLNDVNSYSIGFSFKYLNIPESEQTVQVSLKIGNKEPFYFKGKHLSVEDFRAKFSESIKKIEALEIKDYKKIVDLVKDDFDMKQKYQNKPKQHSQRKNKIK